MKSMYKGLWIDLEATNVSTVPPAPSTSTSSSVTIWPQNLNCQKLLAKIITYKLNKYTLM